MNFWDSFIVISLIAILNIIVFIIFKKYLYRKENAGMKFLTLNISKDLLWLIISLLIIEKTKNNFLLIIICFIVASVTIYTPVIKQINKS
jgi:Co/Zn/Cd efflux system component